MAFKPSPGAPKTLDLEGRSPERPSPPSDALCRAVVGLFLSLSWPLPVWCVPSNPSFSATPGSALRTLFPRARRKGKTTPLPYRARILPLGSVLHPWPGFGSQDHSRARLPALHLQCLS